MVMIWCMHGLQLYHIDVWSNEAHAVCGCHEYSHCHN